MPTLPIIELPTIDLSKLELPFTLPFDLPRIDLPTIDLNKAEPVIDFVKDATLAGTGLVALTAEKVTELQKQVLEVLKAQFDKVRSAA